MRRTILLLCISGATLTAHAQFEAGINAGVYAYQAKSFPNLNQNIYMPTLAIHASYKGFDQGLAGLRVHFQTGRHHRDIRFQAWPLPSANGQQPLLVNGICRFQFSTLDLSYFYCFPKETARIERLYVIGGIAFGWGSLTYFMDDYDQHALTLSAQNQQNFLAQCFLRAGLGYRYTWTHGFQLSFEPHVYLPVGVSFDRSYPLLNHFFGFNLGIGKELR